jgi:peptidoglycan/LPS O-acetylase OafA/YrhL
MRHAGLDALRLSAAALVLLAHGAFFLYPLFPHYDFWLGLGWAGTELFFALSGFLVTGLLLREMPSSGRQALVFGGRRLWRVLPWFWAFVAFNACLWWLRQGSMPDALWLYPALLQNSLIQHPPFFGEAWNLPPLLLFSLLAPLFAHWAQGRDDPRRALRNLLLALALGGLALRGLLVVALDPAWDAGVRKWLPMRLDACAWGGVLACWQARRPAPARIAQVALIGLALLLLAIALFAALPLDASGFARVALFTLIGLGCALPLPWLCRGHSSPWLATAARAMFPLYLINMPLIHVSALTGLASINALIGFVLWSAVSAALAWGLARWRASSRHQPAD